MRYLLALATLCLLLMGCDSNAVQPQVVTDTQRVVYFDCDIDDNFAITLQAYLKQHPEEKIRSITDTGPRKIVVFDINQAE